MSDSTIQTTDVPKPQPPAQEAAATGTEEPKPAKSDETDWKAEARKWEQRAKENTEAAKRLAEIEDANKSEADKTAERLAAAEKRAAEAEARALRREVALEHKLSKDDAALLDSLTDEAAMKALAARLAASGNRNNHVPTEGSNPSPKEDGRRAFADFLTGRTP